MFIKFGLDIEGRHFSQLVVAIAQLIACTAVGIKKSQLICVEHEYRVPCSIEGIFKLIQFRLHCLPFTDIAHDTGKDLSVIHSDFGHRKLHREGCAVFAFADNFATGADNFGFPRALVVR